MRFCHISHIFTTIYVVILLFCWGLSEGEITFTTTPPDPVESDYADEIATTPKELECVTSTGDVGQCTSFEKCYPLTLTSMSIQDVSNLTSSIMWTPLEEDILETSRSILCLNETKTEICCKLENDPESDDNGQVWSDESETFSSETESPMAVTLTSTSTSNPFPKDCGRSSLVSWRRGGGISATWATKGQKITGGRTAAQFQFPWMVAIFGKNGKITCGATLITNDFLLTAAHCLATYSPMDLKQLKIHVGDYNLMNLKDGPHELRRVSQIFLHKEFNIKTYHNDIALIKMDRPVTFSERIQPICLPRGDTNVKEVEGKAVIVAGWGRDRQWGYESSTLRIVEMPVWKLEECHRIYQTFAPNRVNGVMNLCAGDGKKNKDACIGDSGGPLMAEQGNYAFSTSHSPIVQLGIVSWGKGCGSFPGVYTNLATYVPWIIKHIRKSALLESKS